MQWLIEVAREPLVELLSLVLAGAAAELARRARNRAYRAEARADEAVGRRSGS